MPDVPERVDELRREGEAAIAAAPDAAALEELRVRYLGRKAELTGILRGIGELPAEERGAGRIGGQRGPPGARGGARRAGWPELEAGELERGLRGDAVDVTLPGSPAVPIGSRNLLIRTLREIEDVFVGLGYRVMEGPEVELDYYNFTALNHPPGHPARMAQDTFYVDPASLDPELRLEPAPTRPGEEAPGPRCRRAPRTWSCAPTPRRCRCGRWRRPSRRS